MSHQYGDERIVEWLNQNNYHPRSDKHGSASCLYFLEDLLYESEPLRRAAALNQIAYTEDFTVGEGGLRWNVDLVLGPVDTGGSVRQLGEYQVLEAEPAEIWLAIDAKSIMTEHGKARRNRQRDINSFADIMHFHHQDSVTGGILLINIADRFRSPLRDEGDITEHVNIRRLVEETIQLFREIDRSQGEVSSNVDGVATVVVDHTNLDDGQETQLVTEPPAPQAGDIVNYREFVAIIQEIVEERFFS